MKILLYFKGENKKAFFLHNENFIFIVFYQRALYVLCTCSVRALYVLCISAAFHCKSVIEGQDYYPVKKVCSRISYSLIAVYAITTTIIQLYCCCHYMFPILLPLLQSFLKGKQKQKGKHNGHLVGTHSGVQANPAREVVFGRRSS